MGVCGVAARACFGGAVQRAAGVGGAAVTDEAGSAQGVAAAAAVLAAWAAAGAAVGAVREVEGVGGVRAFLAPKAALAEFAASGGTACACSRRVSSPF